MFPQGLKLCLQRGRGGTCWTAHGAPWRDVPARYGPWDRAYDLFCRWQRDGTWARIVTQLQAGAEAKGLITWAVNVNSTACRVAVASGSCRPPQSVGVGVGVGVGTAHASAIARVSQ
ncbi:transposase [Streptomyces sp. NPDC001904]|uniref:transposase n=1 Tax=Streptomyces sp. NPDC001904 TaxID=3154531 RepID=UPI0033211A1A